MKLINRLDPTRLRRSAVPVRSAPKRRSPRRTGRHAAVAIAIGFGLIGLASLALLFNLRNSTSLRDPVFHHRVKSLEGRLKAGPRDYTVIALGSSRMQNGFAGGVIEQAAREKLGLNGVAFNMASPGAGPVATRMDLARLLERGIKPDHVLIEVFPTTLIDQNGSPCEVNSLPAERVRPGEVPLLARYGFDGNSLRAQHAEMDTNPWQALRYQFFERFDKKLIPVGMPLGKAREFDDWGTFAVTLERSPLEHRERNWNTMKDLYGEYLGKGRICGHSVRALDDLLTCCREQGIGVTLLLMPEASYFRALYSPQLLADVESLLAAAAARHGVAFANAREWLPDDEFIDGHHLYFDGAVRFTRRLCDEHLTDALKARKR